MTVGRWMRRHSGAPASPDDSRLRASLGGASSGGAESPGAAGGPRVALAEALASPRVRFLLVLSSGLGYVLCFKALLDHGIYSIGGEGGGDAFAYWRAGRSLLAGQSVYGNDVGGYAAYLYPPVFAQLVAPLSALPMAAFTWLWRAIELVCLRITVGSWRNTGLAMLFWPPVVSELDAGNVHLIVAAAVAQTIRGDARWLVPAALTKFASLAAVPAAIRFGRRDLLVGMAIAFVACAASFAVAPQMWFDYLRFITKATEPQGWFNIGSYVWTPARLAVAAVFALLAFRQPRLSAVAVTLAYPVLWLHSLSTLIAVVAKPADAPTRPELAPIGDGGPGQGR